MFSIILVFFFNIAITSDILLYGNFFIVSDAAKRKSKWDVGISQMPASALKPAALVTPSVLPVPTGTKPTVISAFGTITKKAKQ